MKIATISDTHGKHRRVWPGDLPDDVDVLVHCGDITVYGELEIVRDFNTWLGLFTDIPHKIVIPGNHDFCFEKYFQVSCEHVTNATVLCDTETEIDGVKFYGSPWCPRYGDFAFYQDRGPDMRRKWMPLLEELVKPDVLLTHGPPHGILDMTRTGVNAGCEGLLDAVRIAKPALHVFGHIHEGYGEHFEGPTHFVNASMMDQNYRPKNPVRIVEL